MSNDSGGLGAIMQQVQRVQEQMQQAQADLAALEVSGEAGGGLVTVVVNGKHEVKRVDIDDSLLKDDKSMLEDLIAAAMNHANQRLEAATREKFQGLAGGLNLPPGFKLPF
ncbi:MAG: YbaB/EbfC family nucleoid-associated protein [Pseudomonadota bacterium]